jgi:hypothetical protein
LLGVFEALALKTRSMGSMHRGEDRQIG